MKSIWMSAAAAGVLALAACAEPVADEAETSDAEMAAEAGAGEAEGASEEAMSDGADAEMDDAEMDSGETDSGEAETAALPDQPDARLDAVLAAERRAEDRARDAFRNPEETLEFFGVQPDMTVVEALPGGGWYSRVILPYLNEEGEYFAMTYPMDVLAEIFGESFEGERREQAAAWEQTFPVRAAEWGGEVDRAFRFGAVPAEAEGAADMVLYIRALHNMARTGRLDVAAADAFTLLAPGGVAGVVQHRAPADETDERADGSRGYLREADVIAAFEAAGFTLEESVEINANPADAADYDRGVWMLAPTLGGGEEMAEIGESDRMTLRFRKPE